MRLPKFWNRLFRRDGVRPIAAHDTEPASDKPKQEPQTSEHPEKAHTARNALKFTLERLSSISANIPMGSVLSGVIDSLLAVTDGIEQTSANTQSFIQLTARIKHIERIMSDAPTQGLVDELQQELQSIMDDLEAARSQGKLEQFFNSADNASVIVKHNDRLTQIICTASTINTLEILKSIRDLEEKLEHANNTQIGITGGVGGAGGPGHVGGPGGTGGGPQIDFDPRLNFDHVSGGRGGVGGEGLVEGGTGGAGGAGEGPVIRRSGLN